MVKQPFACGECNRILPDPENKNDPRSSKIGLNCKMDGLGAFDWLGEED